MSGYQKLSKQRIVCVGSKLPRKHNDFHRRLPIMRLNVGVFKPISIGEEGRGEISVSFLSPGLLRRVIARAHLHTLLVLSRPAINTSLAKCLPYYAHLEIELFVRRKNYFVSYFSIIQLNKVIKVIERSK